MRLLTPGRIGKLQVKNRMVMSAIGVGPAAEPDGRVSQRLIDFYVARAQGGTGLIITGPTRVSRHIEQPPDRPFVRNLMADDEMYIAPLRELAEAVHDYGAKIAVQLFPGYGRSVRSAIIKAGGAVAPSPAPCQVDPNVMAREMTTEEVERLVQAFEFASQIVARADVDAIEINGHDALLLDQFMMALWNKRTDKYGGSLDGRLRCAVEMIQAVKKGAGAEFPVIFRFGLKHYLPGGREIDEGLEIARRLEAAGADALHVDAGAENAKYWTLPPTTQPRGCLVDMAAMVKKVVKIPVITVGRLGYPDLAEEVLQEGKADFIALGRALLADPNWVNKVKQKQPEDICPCIGDNEGCHRRLHDRLYLSCSVNPITGMEREFALKPAPKSKGVLVVGGGPAGMEATIISALRGHRVSLWEKSGELGGNLIPAAVPAFKSDYRRLIDYLCNQIAKLGIEVKTNKEATPKSILEAKPEVVILATGASATTKPIKCTRCGVCDLTRFTPTYCYLTSIPGLDEAAKTKTLVSAIDVLLGKTEVSGPTILLGGGLVGCETALHLAQMGKSVSVVARHGAMLDMYWVNRTHLGILLGESNVRIWQNTDITGIQDGEVAIAGGSGKQERLKAETIVFATGLKSNDSLAKALDEKVPEMYTVGDCVTPRKVINAIWDGFRVARRL